MKNLFFASILFLVLNAGAQENDTWRLGLQWGCQGNDAYLKGGMQQADARFQHNSFGGAALDLVARYDYDNHWMLRLGLGMQTFGFEFALSEDYSLLNEEKRYSILRSEFGAIEIPTMVYYKFTPNCKNSRWLIGAGLVQALVGYQSVTQNFTEGTEGNTNGNTLTSVSSSRDVGSRMIRFAISREKLYKRGGILHAGLVFNAGFREIATANVNYTVDGDEYHHVFGNKGNFVGFRVAWFFRPLGVRRDHMPLLK